MELKFHVFNARVAQKLPTVFLQTILPGSAKSKNRAKKEQGRALLVWISVFCNRFGDDFPERFSSLSLDIRQLSLGSR